MRIRRACDRCGRLFNCRQYMSKITYPGNFNEKAEGRFEFCFECASEFQKMVYDFAKFREDTRREADFTKRLDDENGDEDGVDS